MIWMPGSSRMATEANSQYTKWREMTMNKQLMEHIRSFNHKAEMAEADGYTVADGYVWEGWGNPFGFARKVCKVEDYAG